MTTCPVRRASTVNLQLCERDVLPLMILKLLLRPVDNNWKSLFSGAKSGEPSTSSVLSKTP